MSVLSRATGAGAALLVTTAFCGASLAQAVDASEAAHGPAVADDAFDEEGSGGDDEGSGGDDEGIFVEAGSGPDETTLFEESMSVPEAARDLLDIYGFADLTYRQFLSRRDNQWRNYSSADYPSFAVGNFNVYLSTRISERWRALGEVRFAYLPNGAQTIGPDGTVASGDTTVADYTDLSRDTRLGGIKIERVWIELNANQYLNVRAGQWLTPYGVWNVDHGSPVIITTQRPFAIGEQLFPERQTGLQLRGQVYLGASTLEYVATLSNGRGAADEYRDLDGNKAMGAHVALRSQPFGELTIGASIYGGRFVEVSKTTRIETLPDGPDLVFDSRRDIEADELSYAADLRWNWEGLLLQTELVANETRFKEGARPLLAAPDPAARQPDFLRWGGYILLGYRTPWAGIMPFCTLQYLDLTNTDALPPLWGGSYGVNIRPDPRVVIKGEYLTGLLAGVGSVGYRDPIRLFQAQVAWAF